MVGQVCLGHIDHISILRVVHLMHSEEKSILEDDEPDVRADCPDIALSLVMISYAVVHSTYQLRCTLSLELSRLITTRFYQESGSNGGVLMPTI